jgi:hypothetical protein
VKDIVTRLRAVFHNDRSVELMNREAADEIARLTAERDEAREAIVRLNAECTRLACRNAVLVLELDRVNAGTVRLKQDIEASIRRALYAGEG